LLLSEPFLLLGPVLVISTQDSLQELNEARRKIIGIDATSQSIMTLSLDKDPSIQLRLYDNALQALADLDNHRIDGVVLHSLPAYIYTQTFYSGRLKVATTTLNDEGIRLMTLKNANGQALIQLFNHGLNTLRENGTYDQLLNDWGLVNPYKIESHLSAF
jgi:polar amino acid transport system substrate-binding protein